MRRILKVLHWRGLRWTALLKLHRGHNTVCVVEVESGAGLGRLRGHRAVRPEPNIILQAARPARIARHDGSLVIIGWLLLLPSADARVIGRGAEHVGRFLFVHYELLHVDFVVR